MDMNKNIPTAAEVEAGVDRVHDKLFARLGQSRRSPVLRNVVAVVAAVALFGGGIGVGAAAANASTPNRPAPVVSGPATAPTSGPSEFTFSVDCYVASDSSHPSTSEPSIQLGFNKVTDPTGALLAAAAADPASACRAKVDELARTESFFTAAQQQPATATCVTLSMAGIAPFYFWTTWDDPTNLKEPPVADWEARPQGYTQQNRLMTGSFLKPSGYPSDCAQASVSTPSVSHPPLAACVIDDRHAAVFTIKSDASVSSTCRVRGYQPWTN